MCEQGRSTTDRQETLGKLDQLLLNALDERLQLLWILS